MERFLLAGTAVLLDKQIAVVEEILDLLLESLTASGSSPLRFRGTPPGQLGHRGGECFPYAGDGSKDRLSNVGDDVELADLVRDAGKNRLEGLGIQGRPVCGDPEDRQTPGVHRAAEAPEKAFDVRAGRIVVQDLVDQAGMAAVVDKRKDAE